MYTSPSSIGDPEGSLDTPLRNTTPLGKRQRNDGTRLAPAKRSKPRKMNQCQELCYISCVSRSMEDKFDPNSDAVDELLNGMDQGLDDDKDRIRVMKRDEDGLLQSFEELKDRLGAVQKSRARVGEELIRLAAISGNQQPNSADIDMSNRDERDPILIIYECIKIHGKRMLNLQDALETTDTVKRQLKEFRDDFGQVRAEFLKQLEGVKVEYEARLSQQRRELKGAWKEDLKAQLAAYQSPRLPAADEAMARLSSQLAAAEKAKDTAVYLLAATDRDLAVSKDALQVAAMDQADWKASASKLSIKNKELSTRLEKYKAECTEIVKQANRRLHEGSLELQAARSSLVESDACVAETRKQLGASTADYATLLIDVALAQKEKLRHARSQITQLDGYLILAKSRFQRQKGTIDSLRAESKAKVAQTEVQDKALGRKEKLLRVKISENEHLKEELKKRQRTLDQQDETISARRIQLLELNETNNELETALKAKDDLLASNATKLSDKRLEIRNLTDRASSAAKELIVQRSTLARNQEQLRELEKLKRKQDAMIQKLRSDLDLKDSEVAANASTITSYKGRIERLEDANRDLLSREEEKSAAMTRLEAESSKFRLALDTKKLELKSQTTFVAQRDATIRELETTNTRLSRAKTDAISEMDVLKTRLSVLALEVKTKDKELRVQTSAAALHEQQVRSLEGTKAGFLRAQEEAENDKARLHIALKSANRMTGKLEAELERLTGQLSSCHCSIKRSSRKRAHDEVDSQRDEISSADESARSARKLEKASELTASLNSVALSGDGITRRNATSPERRESRELSNSHLAGPSTNSAGPLMGMTGPGASGTTNATIVPSGSSAFAIQLGDARNSNFSSYMLPIDIRRTLRRRFRIWNANTSFNWYTEQSFGSRNCIETRLERKKSQWNDGPEYACAVCEQRMRLCLVLDNPQRLLLLPRKAAENNGGRPTDTTYWER